MPVTRPVAASQVGRHPSKREAVGDLLAAGAQRRAAPEIDDERARHLAMGLQVFADDFVGGEPAEVHRRRRRQHARIGGVEIAAGGQHVGATARRRACGTGGNAAAVERGEKRRALGLGAGVPTRVVGRGRAAVDMQAVLDGEVLEVAQPGIDAAQHLVGVRAGIDAGLAGEAAAPRGLDDQAGETVAAAAVEPVGLGVFVDQSLERAGIAREPGRDQRRRQMADGDRGDAALRLCRLAGIADDEGIEHRQRPHHRFGKARAVSATALPGSHSSVPWAPMCTSASTSATWRSHSMKASSAWRGGSVASW